ncbi:MAG: hypothetical protein P9L94_15185 [Candidatus Hinthialibacter antarcticus]|nr:hypothetical protein [Candidatus Hinthialibacter antarcticus]
MQIQIVLSLLRDCAGPFVITLLIMAGFIFILRKVNPPILLQLNKQHGLLLFYIAIGWFVVRSLFWGYYAYEASISRPPGSFRMNGAAHAIQAAGQWRFPQLQALAKTHWLIPENKGPGFSKPMPSDGFARMQDGAIEAERFRRSLYNNDTNQLIYLVKEIIGFKESVAPILEAPYGFDRFDISDKTLTQALKDGVSLQSGLDSFQAFAGAWYGLWEENPVDHEWSQTEQYSPPYKIQQENITLYIHALQYAWIGDGFGWNLVISPETPDSNTFILGSVYHVRDQKPSQVYLHRPHVGVAIDGNLIWITAGEVFFEEAYLERSPQQYSITGFFYEWQNGQMNRKGDGFQAVYSRESKNRVPWRRLSLQQE